MNITVYNTLTRTKESFVPLDPQRVTMYVCGPTVYNYAHIGNARPPVIFDLWRRVLQTRYEHVVYVSNITDVEDKINAAAAAQGVPISDITRRFTNIYIEDMAALGVQPPDVRPRATEHIPEIISMIKALIDSGHAYEAKQHVLFDVSAYPDYGQLSRRDRREMIAGARVEVAPYKRQPEDFVLWKPSSGDLPGWDSPWGYGRPGWHIECSAMAAKHLGEVIDIHGGGSDLVFPHHENELAQSCCAHQQDRFARYWLHNGFVQMESRKMSKSLGNVLTVHELLQQHPGEVLRYVLLSAHYHQPLDWSDAAVTQAHKTLDRLYAIARDHLQPVAAAASVPDAVLSALYDDLNTPKALAAFNQLCRDLAAAKHSAEKQDLSADIRAAGALLGLLQEAPEAWFGRQKQALDADAIDALIAARDAARQQRDFARADAIRAELDAMHVIIEDSAEGTKWRVRQGSTES